MENLTGVAAADMVGRGNYEYALPFYGERRPVLIDLVREWGTLDFRSIRVKSGGLSMP